MRAENEIKCYECNRFFRSVECYQNHKNGICNVYKVCENCSSGYKVSKKQPHICGMKMCLRCKGVRPTQHDCYFPTASIKEEEGDEFDKTIFVFFDFETTQNDRLPTATEKFEHKVNLCVAQQVCRYCMNDFDNLEINCEYCGKREHIFEGENSLKYFMEYLAERIDFKFRKVICLAHNMQGYDGHFCLRYMYKNNNKWGLSENSIIMNGTKILKIAVGRFIFLDSLNYLSASLSKLPKMFNIKECKGWFPHLFNIKIHSNYVGPYPDLKYYSPDTMSSSERDELIKWYNLKMENNEIFNMREQLISYCKLDVDILRKACIQFRSLLMNLTSVDPFDGPITIASTCMTVFRTNYLKEDTIGYIPKNGYRGMDKQSIKAIQWLEVMKHLMNWDIKHAGNGKEYRLFGNIKVDGITFDTNPPTVFEYLGCWWHKCEKCFPIQSRKTDEKISFGLKRDADRIRFEKIEKNGYNLITIWECEFDEVIKKHKSISDYIKSLKHIHDSPLDVRDGFFGGRCNSVRLYHKTAPNEKIHFYDVCSLYPYVLKYCAMPIGHPKILIGSDIEGRTPLNTEGIFKLKILPPKDLYHPVLPIEMHQRLLFILCYTCSLNKIKSACNHEDKDRAFIGTYVADELRVAISKGYTVIETYEIWEYKLCKYNKKTNEPGLFSEYIDAFLKVKVEASGYPEWVKNETDKDKYIQQFLENESILLNKEQISKNAGLRTLGKALLNFLYGKFGQRVDKSMKYIASKRNQITELLSNENVEVQSMTQLTDESVLFTYKYLKEANPEQGYVNVSIAAYTTAHARCILYKYLDMLKERVFYFDTDSILFLSKDGDEMPETGDYLGNMTNELEQYGPNAYISEFAAGGPKNYGYKVRMNDESEEEKIVCKVKGIRLNYMNSRIINFETIKNLLLSHSLEEEEQKKNRDKE